MILKTDWVAVHSGRSARVLELKKRNWHCNKSRKSKHFYLTATDSYNRGQRSSIHCGTMLTNGWFIEAHKTFFCKRRIIPGGRAKQMNIVTHIMCLASGLCLFICLIYLLGFTETQHWRRKFPSQVEFPISDLYVNTDKGFRSPNTLLLSLSAKCQDWGLQLHSFC